MKNKQYLTFRLHNLQYGIEAALVQEIFPLPELTLIDKAVTNIIGILNFRGQIVPILHLDLLRQYSVKSCHLSDYIIVMQWEGLQFGLVVHQVNEVLDVNTEAIETEPFYELLCDSDAEFIAEVAKLDLGNIVLLDPKTLTNQLDDILPLIWDAQMQLDITTSSSNSDVVQQLGQDVLQQNTEIQTHETFTSFYDLYCFEVTPEEKAIFRQRSDKLRQSVESLQVINELIHLAVIGFENEYFGLNLELVREFIDIDNLIPIPCCPNYIVGNMNLRGEIVTLVDIRNILNLPTPPVGIGSPAVVVQVDDIVTGLPVDRVLEMVELNSADITPLPTTISDVGEQYLQGTAFFQEKLLRVLDLPKIFTKGELIVDEEV
ncbi:chemotaxis protein CheW [Microcoleus sp. FACHB-SPT15]|uniref:chemotaxis protein CheW n=1 Tax=Microcoleus sp. FACHB-SPT15 TaxID=2692830 RepID=UPI00177AB3BF|nr:chemotaxis protein CheW [Microcoleus sp. FACHB-SPT15]MBD1808039.1 chemotaxis protein CheW [Microcoleus sp. FACHB-SPT15]